MRRTMRSRLVAVLAAVTIVLAGLPAGAHTQHAQASWSGWFQCETNEQVRIRWNVDGSNGPFVGLSWSGVFGSGSTQFTNQGYGDEAVDVNLVAWDTGKSQVYSATITSLYPYTAVGHYAAFRCVPA